MPIALRGAHFETGLKSQKLMAKDAVLAEAQRAKQAGATRFCMGAAWRTPKTARSRTWPRSSPG